ncbi:CcdB family protein [Arhodomonas sp. AD133]
MLLATQHLAAVSRPTLGETVASLADERETIVAAVDLLFTGI